MKYPDWIYTELAAIKELSDNDAADIRSLTEALVGYADQARHDGILALEDAIEGIEDALLRLGMLLIVDGTDTGAVIETLTNALLSRRGSPELLKGVVIIDGVIGIQEGINPLLLKAMLLSYLGADAALGGYQAG